MEHTHPRLLAQDATEMFEHLRATLNSLVHHANELLGRQQLMFREISEAQFALTPATGGDGVGVQLINATFIFAYRSGGFVPAAKARNRWFRLIKDETSARLALSVRPDHAGVLVTFDQMARHIAEPLFCNDVSPCKRNYGR